MKKTDLSTYNENCELSEALNHKDLNFGYLMATSLEGKLSITAKYDPPQKEKCVKLDGDLNTVPLDDNDEFYYGVSPLFDNDQIIKVISKLKIKTQTDLVQYIKENPDWFMIHNRHEQYLSDIAKLIVVSVTCAFSIKIHMTKDEYNKIVSGCDDFCDETCSWKTDNDFKIEKTGKKALCPPIRFIYHCKKSRKIKSPKSETQDSSGVLTIHGCPTAQMLDRLSEWKYKRYYNTELYKDDVIWQISSDGNEEIKDVYENKESISLTNGNVFYSGTMLRPVKIDPPKISCEDDKVRSVVVCFERTTYATVLTFDSNYSNHPLLKNNSNIVSVFKEDDKLKKSLINNLGKAGDGSDEDIYGAVNDYLKACYNPTQIGVSGIIITSDKKFIFSHRGSGNIDSGGIYPGVNGNAEIADKNVSFYAHSMYEDVPRIKLDDSRIDFLGEISRETYDELSLDLNEQNWDCCGIMLSGNTTQLGVKDKGYNRRLHFNIIFEQKVDYTFPQIDKMRKKANERFESDEYIAFSVICKRDCCTWLLWKLGRFMGFVVKQKDFLEATLLFLLIIYSLCKRDLSGDPLWYKVATGSMAVLIIIYYLIKIIVAVHHGIVYFKKTKYLRLYRNMTEEDKKKKMLKKMKKSILHPVAYASYLLYVDRLLMESFFSKKI